MTLGHYKLSNVKLFWKLHSKPIWLKNRFDWAWDLCLCVFDKIAPLIPTVFFVFPVV